jgi:hypothetical protein
MKEENNGSVISLALTMLVIMIVIAVISSGLFYVGKASEDIQLHNNNGDFDVIIKTKERFFDKYDLYKQSETLEIVDTLYVPQKMKGKVQFQIKEQQLENKFSYDFKRNQHMVYKGENNTITIELNAKTKISCNNCD